MDTTAPCREHNAKIMQFRLHELITLRSAAVTSELLADAAGAV